MYNPLGSTSTGPASGARTQSDLTRSDFKRIDIKGQGNKYYFSFEDRSLGVELCLEPCMNGFDVGFYKNQELLNKKVCTNMKGMVFKKEEEISKKKDIQTPEQKQELFDSCVQMELMQGVQERSETAWDKGLSIANDFLRQYRNEEKLKKWNMIPDDEGNRPETVPKSNPFPADYENDWKDAMEQARKLQEENTWLKDQAKTSGSYRSDSTGPDPTGSPDKSGYSPETEDSNKP